MTRRLPLPLPAEVVARRQIQSAGPGQTDTTYTSTRARAYIPAGVMVRRQVQGVAGTRRGIARSAGRRCPMGPAETTFPLRPSEVANGGQRWSLAGQLAVSEGDPSEPGDGRQLITLQIQILRCGCGAVAVSEAAARPRAYSVATSLSIWSPGEKRTWRVAACSER